MTVRILTQQDRGRRLGNIILEMKSISGKIYATTVPEVFHLLVSPEINAYLYREISKAEHGLSVNMLIFFTTQ